MSPEETIETTAIEEVAPDTPPVKVRWEGRWNHEANHAEWHRIEETGETLDVEPKVVETPRPNRAGRRRFKAVIARLIRRTQRRQAKAQPKQCSQCAAPFIGMHFPIMEVNEAGEATDKVRSVVFWQCQCKPACKPRVDTGGEEEAEQA